MNLRILAMLLWLAWLGQAAAQAPLVGPNQGISTRVDSNCCLRLGCCIDDYCKKPCPPLFPVSYCGGPNDYDRKCIPCLTCVPHCGGVDDYCRKPLPPLLCTPLSPFLQCVPGQCAPTAQKRILP